MGNAEVLERSYNRIVSVWRALDDDGEQGRDALLEAFGVRFSYNSGRIENARITYHDTRDVFENGKVVGYSGDVRTLFEIQNLKTCHEFMLQVLAQRKPISKSLVLQFHQTLTQGTYDERRWERGERPGHFKRGDYVVGARDSGAPAARVATLVDELCGELEVVTRDNVLTAAAYFHLVFEGIHPFADGNGRCGRALMNYLLLVNDHPPVIVFDDDKLAYYGAIEVWDAEADLSPMVEFLKAETVRTWHRRLAGEQPSRGTRGVDVGSR